MSRLAGLLINGDPERPGVEFFPATMVCYVRSAARWKMSWVDRALAAANGVDHGKGMF